jgi:hypothetical protein
LSAWLRAVLKKNRSLPFHWKKVQPTQITNENKKDVLSCQKKRKLSYLWGFKFRPSLISSRYVRCTDYKRFLRVSWPMLTAGCETGTHLFFACRVSRGLGNDSPEFIPAMLQSAQVIHYDRLLADAAYDGEHNHQLCREILGIRQTMIPLNPRRGKSCPKAATVSK